MNDFGTFFTNSPTLINNSTLAIGAGGISLGADAIIENNGSGIITVAGPMDLLDESSFHNAGKITLQDGGDFNDSGIFTDSNNVAHSGSVTNSGTIEIAGGTLSLEVAVANAGGGIIQIDSGATLQLNNAAINGGTINDDDAITGYGSISSIIAGSGAVTATGGTLTLSGLNTYSGTTTIDPGAVLAAGVAGTFSANSAVTDNGELDLGTTDQTIKALNGTNTAALVGSFSGTGAGPAVLTIGTGGSFAGVIEDGTAGAATALTLTAGTETLTGTNTYTGATTINGGTLALSVAGSIAESADVAVGDGAAGATFDISGLTNGGTMIVTLGRWRRHRQSGQQHADADGCLDHVQRGDRRRRRTDADDGHRDAERRQSL
jgi:autotransporter-associated beta strand protein